MIRRVVKTEKIQKLELSVKVRFCERVRKEMERRKKGKK